MHEILMDMKEQLGRIEGRQEAYLREQERLADVDAALSVRVTKLERTEDRRVGWAAGAGAVAALAFSAFVTAVKFLIAKP